MDRGVLKTTRRAFSGAALALACAGTLGSARAQSEVRLGVLQFGTVQWIADVIRRNGLEASHGIALRTLILANSDAGRIALMANSADVVVSDWLFAAAQRSAGTRLCFAPFSDATGGVMVGPDSTLGGLTDLKARRIGVAGGSIDKSWLLVQAAGQAKGIDLARATRVAFGAPPLLNAKLLQGELDAVLTYWNFAARLQAAGCRQVVSVADCARSLGLPPPLNLVGYVFRQEWADADPARINGFLRAAAEADRLLASSDAEWHLVRPLMDAPDDRLFETLKQHYLAGIAHTTAEQEQRTAARVLDVLLRTGGVQATAGLERLPEGLFWPVPDAAR